MRSYFDLDFDNMRQFKIFIFNVTEKIKDLFLNLYLAHINLTNILIILMQINLSI